MVSTRNTSRSNANLPRMQDPPSDADSRPPSALEMMQANTDEVEARRLTNQCLIEELEQLTRQMQRPQEARQTQEGHNNTLCEGQHNLDIPRGAETEAESSRARVHGPHLAPGEEDNEATLGGHVGNEELRHPQQGRGEQSWEQRFKSLQQELSRVKEVVRGRVGPLSRPDPFWRIRIESEMPCYHSIIQNPIFAEAISKFGQTYKHLHLTKYIYHEDIQAFSK